MNSATVIAPGEGEKFWIVGGKPSRKLVIAIPGGLERFYEDVAGASDLSPAAVRQFILKHGMDLPGS
jgi:hypothetical protein